MLLLHTAPPQTPANVAVQQFLNGIMRRWADLSILWHCSFDPTRAVQATVYDQQVEADFLHERSDGQLDLLELEQDMARILGQSCTYVSAGWWTYELCYLRSVRQLHVSSAGVPDQVHLIGVPLLMILPLLHANV